MYSMATSHPQMSYLNDGSFAPMSNGGQQNQPPAPMNMNNVSLNSAPPPLSSLMQMSAPHAPTHTSASTTAAIAAAASAAANYQLQQLVSSTPSDNIVESPNSNSFADSKTNLIVNYLPQTMTQEEFKALFSSMGEVDSCKLVRDKATGQSLGYGFVNFVRLEDAQKAVNNLNGLRLQNKLIKVSFARPSSENIKGANLYVSGLTKTVTQEELEEMFKPFGHIITSRILTDPTSGQSKGVGFVRFDKKEEAEAAIEKLNNTVPEGGTEQITVKFANNPSGGGGTPKNALQTSAMIPLALFNAAQARRFPGPIHSTTNSGRFRYSPLGADILTAGSFLSAAAASAAVPSPASIGYTIFVYNLAPETEDSILWQLFGPFGAVLSVKVIRDLQTNKCKGYGFVTMAVYEESMTAIAHLHGTTLGGRVLQVSFKSQSNKKGHNMSQ